MGKEKQLLLTDGDVGHRVSPASEACSYRLRARRRHRPWPVDVVGDDKNPQQWRGMRRL